MILNRTENLLSYRNMILWCKWGYGWKDLQFEKKIYRSNSTFINSAVLILFQSYWVLVVFKY